MIRVDTYIGAYQLTIPFAETGGMGSLTLGSLLLFLGFWAMAFLRALGSLLAGEPFGLFLVFWLLLWSMGGAGVGYAVIRMLRQPIPMKILLNKPNLSIDTGSPPFVFSYTGGWSQLKSTRKFFEVQPDLVKTLALKKTPGGNRLTIDVGTERVEIGTGLSEEERVWIYNYLVESYS